MAVDWARPKDPSEIVDYSHDWTLDLGDDTIAVSTWTPVNAAGTAEHSNSNTATVARIFLSGGTAGETALWLNRITTAAGRVLEEAFRLAIVDAAAVAVAPSELDQLRLDRAAVYAAKLALLKGERVREVARDGRRMVMDGANMTQIDAALAEIDRGIAALTAAAAGTRRRRAFRLSFG